MRQIWAESSNKSESLAKQQEDEEEEEQQQGEELIEAASPGPIAPFAEDEPAQDKKSWIGHLKWIGSRLLGMWFLGGMAVVIGLAYRFPHVAASGGIIRSEYSLSYAAVAIIFFLSGLGIPTKVMLINAGNWRAHLVAQIFSFLITPAICFGFSCAIMKANNPAIHPDILAGIIVTGCNPTTVSSNVVMTKQAGGNDSLAIIEVSIGNLLGAFISPLLVQMFFSPHSMFAFANPTSSDFTLSSLYRQVMKQLGCALFVPLFVGQVLQNLFPKQVKWTLATFRLGKLGSVMLILLIWKTFSDAFYHHAFDVVTHAAVIMVCFMNVGFYVLFTILVFVVCHYRPLQFTPRDTVAIMLCAAAKTVALGVPLLDAQYGTDSVRSAIMSLPLVLYQGEQIFLAQFMIPLFRHYIKRYENRENNKVNSSQEDPSSLEENINTNSDNKNNTHDDGEK